MPAKKTFCSAYLDWLRDRLGGPPKPAPVVERRILPRRPIQFPARIQGSQGRYPAMGVNFHDQGALLVSRIAWPVGTVVFLDFKFFWLMGFARVRHCTPREDRNYAIGLQYCAPLMRQEIGTWKIERIPCPVDDEPGVDPEEPPAGSLQAA